MKLSIITVNLNNLPGLQKNMQSVLAQTITGYECIVIERGKQAINGQIMIHGNNFVYCVSKKDNEN